MVFPCPVYIIVKQILLSVSSVAICDDALPNSRSLLIFHLFAAQSTLEYAASVWDPHLAKDINKLENIQRRSARFVKGDYVAVRYVGHTERVLASLDFTVPYRRGYSRYSSIREYKRHRSAVVWVCLRAWVT